MHMMQQNFVLPKKSQKKDFRQQESASAADVIPVVQADCTQQDFGHMAH